MTNIHIEITRTELVKNHVKDTIGDLLFFQKGGGYNGYLQQRLTSIYIVYRMFTHKNFYVFSHFPVH